MNRIAVAVRWLLAVTWIGMFSPAILTAQKTVHVEPYTRKDGTHVDGYDRRPPTKHAAPSAPPDPKSSKAPASPSAPSTPAAPFPPSAVTATPVMSASGNALSSDADPVARSVPAYPAATLVGQSATAVRLLLGSPSVALNGGWDYDTPIGTLHLILEDSAVKEARPMDFDVSVLTAPRVVPSAGPPQPPKRPTGAVAKCGDGLYVFVSTGDKTCRNNNGVAEWYIRE